MNPIVRLGRCLGPYRRDLILAAVMVAVETVFELVIPVLMAAIIDDGVINGDMDVIFQKGVLMGVCALISLLSGLSYARFAARASYGLGARIREAEYEAVLSLERTTQKVIAAGGGTVTCERSCQALKKSCILFFINPGFEDCCRRILGDAGRPIAASSTREELQALYERRFPLYRQAADYEIYNHGTTADAVGAIIASLRDEF